MKKSMLCAGLISVLSAPAYAEEHGNLNSIKNNLQLAKQQPVQILASSNSVSTPIIPQANLKTPNSDTIQTPKEPGVQPPPAVGTPTQTTGSAPTPALDTSTSPGSQTPAAGSQTPAGSQAPVSGITAPQPLNCKYHIPSETSHIEQTIVTKWAENAVEQSFDFDFNTIDKQISDLKSCYTDQGWQGFNDALEKSGNLNAIKTQKLTVSSMVTGESKITEIKENQWKITIPLHVVYQNDKEKLTQPLSISLVVGRKPSGDLGIMQMIATPSQSTTSFSGGKAPETSTTTQSTQ